MLQQHTSLAFGALTTILNVIVINVADPISLWLLSLKKKNIM